MRILITIVIVSRLALAQAPGNSSNIPPATPPALPIPTQIRKSVVFLQTDCLHDFKPDLALVAPDALARLQADQIVAIKQRLSTFLSQAQTLKVSVSKLSLDERLMLKPEALSALNPAQMVGLLAKMTDLSDKDLDSLSPEQISILPMDSSLGTGFIMSLADSRARVPAGADPNTYGFSYLITNRHVAQPGVDTGKPCHIVRHSMLLNRRPDSTHSTPYAERLAVERGGWVFPTDASVDLAATNFPASFDLYDFIRIPNTLFVTLQMIQEKKVVEGDPVYFAGLFIQSFQQLHSVEPIVRSGILAMVPNEGIETTLHKPGTVYLAEAHTFGGNSGSPIFIDDAKFTVPFGFGMDFHLLGVISGEVYETSDFVMHVTASYTGNVQANSDVSVVVPAFEIINLLNSPIFKTQRDAYFTAHPQQ